MDEQEKYINQMVKRNRRRERIRNFIHKSKLVWVLDPYPYETHKLRPRSIVENFKREKVRQTYSWHNISRLQNEKAYKAGLAGIITAPILASLAINQPLFVSFEFPIQMAFIFLSGILFVLAGVIYNYRVPTFVKAYMEVKENKKYKAAPISQIHSSIFLEFLNLGRTTEITPKNLHELQDHQIAYETAGLLLRQGGACYKVGFDEIGQAYIERLIYKLSEKKKFKVFEEYKRKDGELGLRERMGPCTTYSTGAIYVRHLKIEKACKHYISVSTPERVEGEFSKEDIVIDFYDPYIQTPNQIDKQDQLEPYTSDLSVILKEDYLDILVEEISYWQSWQRPFSRVLALWLYRLSLFSFGIFLIYQASIVWGALQI
ncbi:hypothetical protein C4D07_RS03160 [Vibrio parahaemolyticus]|nr:hypothetical protein [Vibrio parahaemolyticus]